MGLLGDIIGAFSNHKTNRSTARAGADSMRGYTEALDNSKGMFNTVQGQLQPYMDAGGGAVNSLAQLLGLGSGGPGGSAAIDALKNSPLYQSLFHNGQNSILQAGSATGGLRGGDMQHSLYNLGTDTLGQVFQNQVQNLSGLSGLGAQTAGRFGELSGQAAGQQGAALANRGNAAMNMVLGKIPQEQSQGHLFGDAAGSIMSMFAGGGNPFASLSGMGGGASGIGSAFGNAGNIMSSFKF